MIQHSRYGLWPLVLFFAVGELLSHALSLFAPLWWFLSPLQWVGSLALVMTGALETIDALLGTLTYSGHGAISALIAAVEAGLLGTMLTISFTMILEYTSKASKLGGLLFRSTFIPIWALLLLYKPLIQRWNDFASFAGGLENMEGDIRLSAGFGILLLSVIIPMLAFLSTKAMELIMNPEASYLDPSE